MQSNARQVAGEGAGIRNGCDQFHISLYDSSWARGGSFRPPTALLERPVRTIASIDGRTGPLDTVYHDRRTPGRELALVGHTADPLAVRSLEPDVNIRTHPTVASRSIRPMVLDRRSVRARYRSVVRVILGREPTRETFVPGEDNAEASAPDRRLAVERPTEEFGRPPRGTPGYRLLVADYRERTDGENDSHSSSGRHPVETCVRATFASESKRSGIVDRNSLP